MKQHDLSDRKLKVAFVLAVAIIGWFCLKGASFAHGQSNPANLSPGVQEVVKLAQAHMTDDVILAYIKNSGQSYHLSADDILYLNSQGVSQAVLNALLNAKSDATPAPPPANVPPPDVAPASVPPPILGQPMTPPPTVAPAPSAPLPGSDVTLSYFQTQLAPYGTWVNSPGNGLCWRPTIQDAVPGWRPYFNNGHWDYTDDGWYWRSDYPWGEYVFHYGRWARDPQFGWVWLPGYQWAPAWVAWRNAEAEGFCGWAPLPPGAVYQPGVGLFWNGHLATDVDFGLGPDAFVFVPFDHFWDHDYRAFLAPGWRLPGLFRASIVLNGYGFVGGHFFIGGIGRDRIAFLTHHAVAIGRIDFHDAHIAHARDLEHARAMDAMHGRGGFGGRDFDHR